MPLRLVIENTPSDEFDPMPQNSSADYVEAALRTAINSNSAKRSDILADVCEILSCRSGDLNFLFEHHAVPTKNRRVFDLELPDYRMHMSEIYKEAAE